jgi:hypothetical protein
MGRPCLGKRLGWHTFVTNRASGLFSKIKYRATVPEIQIGHMGAYAPAIGKIF